MNSSTITTATPDETSRAVQTIQLGLALALPPVSGHGLSGELNFRGL